MNRIIIKRVSRDGVDAELFRAYSYPDKAGKTSSLHIALSCTGGTTFGVLGCAAKAFTQFCEPQAERREIETRIAIQQVDDREWVAMLQSRNESGSALICPRCKINSAMQINLSTLNWWCSSCNTCWETNYLNGWNDGLKAAQPNPELLTRVVGPTESGPGLPSEVETNPRKASRLAAGMSDADLIQTLQRIGWSMFMQFENQMPAAVVAEVVRRHRSSNGAPPRAERAGRPNADLNHGEDGK